MKKMLFVFWGLFFTMTLGAQNLIKMAPQIVVVNLGPKNPHFDESIYPHLKFYYLPDLKADLPHPGAINGKFRMEGAPDFFVKAYNDGHIKQYGFMLFDKNGICFTEGNNFLEAIDIGKAMCSNGKSLGDNIKEVVKKGKTAKVKQGPLPWNKSNVSLKVGLRHSAVVKRAFLTGHSFPAGLKAETPDGKQVGLEKAVKGHPTLVTFVYIPPSGNLETLDKYYRGNAPKPPEPVRKKYVEDVLHLSMLEGQFFNFNPKKALKKKYGK